VVVDCAGIVQHSFVHDTCVFCIVGLDAASQVGKLNQITHSYRLLYKAATAHP
jgi:hypothetical protein